MRSAKAIKITDAALLKRLAIICGCIGIGLLVRTIVAPPLVIVGRTADDLKAYLCKTDWWDHTFTSSKYRNDATTLNKLNEINVPKLHLYSLLFYPICCASFRFISGSSVFSMGCPIVHNGTKSTIRVQWEPIYLYGHLQRVPAHLFPECFHVSALIFTISYPVSMMAIDLRMESFFCCINHILIQQ